MRNAGATLTLYVDRGRVMVKVRIQGADALAADFLALERAERTQALRVGTRAGAKAIQEAIRARVPVKTGLLRRNIVLGNERSLSPSTTHTTVVRLSKGGGRYANTKSNVRKRRVGKSYAADGPAFYGKFIELGTSRMAAKPYMRPGFDAAQDEAGKAVERAVAEAIDKVMERKR